MSFRLNSLSVAGKWKVKRQMFHNQNKFYVKAICQNSIKNKQTTLILMMYDELMEQSLFKTIQRLNQQSKQNLKLIVPDLPVVDIVGKSKMFVMAVKEKPVSLHSLIRQKYLFSHRQVLQAAISGIASLSEMHSFNIAHGCINTKNCYFYNRQNKALSKKTNKSQIVTCFGFNLIDIQKFSIRGFKISQKTEYILYQSISKKLKLKSGFKQDLQSLLYVLIKMATQDQIFSAKRYAQEWGNEQAVRKWKVNDLYLQMLNKIPRQLSILIQIYLYIQQIDSSEKPDYSLILRKLWKQRQCQMIKQTQCQSVHDLKNQQTIFIQLNETINQNEDSCDQILDQEIKIEVRTQQTNFYKLSSDLSNQ